MRHTTRIFVPLMLLALLAGAGGCSLINRLNLNAVSVEEEKGLGNELRKQLDEEFSSRGMIFREPEINRYVQEVGGKLVAAIPGREFDYTFTVVKTPVVNAFSIPGGHVFVFTGLIAEVDDEAELAGVLAHEIGHVVARHATERLTAAVATEAATQVFVGSRKRAWSQAVAGLAAEIAGTSGMLAYSRVAEEEADLIAADLMTSAGYDPRALGDFYRRIHQKLGHMSRTEVFFSTHPDPFERTLKVDEYIAQKIKPAPDLVRDSPEFHAVQDRVRELKYDPEQGTDKASVFGHH